MALVGLVNLSFKCFDGLAWPLFALGYPLYASIQAIETDLDWHTRKLVTYWVLFSLISLFEHTFVKLLECLPFWSYIRLFIICWLVIPHFNGAVYVYKHLVRPCLSMDLQTVINWFNKKKDFLLKRENFLAEAERYVEENGPEALEKLIASKSKSTKPYLVLEESRAAAEEGEGSKCQEPSVMQKDIKTVEVSEKKEVTEAKPSKCREPNATQTDNKIVEVTEKKEVTEAKQAIAYIENRTVAPVEIKETTAAVESGWEHPQIPAFKKVQNEWTCGICQVTTQRESDLNSHLQGKRHQAACEELKAKNQASRSKVSHALVSKKADLPKEKCVSANICSSKVSSQEAKKSDPPKEEPQKCASSNGLKRRTIARYEVKKSDVCKEEQEKCVSNNGWNFSTSHGAKKSDPPKEEPEKCASSNGLKSRFVARYEVNKLLKEEKEKCVSNNGWDFSTSHEAKKSDPPKEEPEKCASSNGLKCRIVARYEVKKSDVPKEEQEKCVSNNGWDFSTSHEAKKSDPPKEEPEKCASSNGLKCRIVARYEVKKSVVPKEEQEKCVSNNGWDFSTSHVEKKSDPPKEEPEMCASSNGLKSRIITRYEVKKSDIPKEEQEKCVSNNGWDFSTSHEAKKSDPPKEEELEKSASSNGLKSRIIPRYEVKKSDVLKEEEEKCVSNNGWDFSTITKQEEKVQGQQDNLKNKYVEFKQFKWWCRICNISCNSEGDMDCHLNGKKHLFQVWGFNHLGGSGWD